MLRLLLATLLAAAPWLFLTGADAIQRSFTFSLPLMVACGGALLRALQRTRPHPAGPMALALLLVVPALSVGWWHTGLAIEEQLYAEPHRALEVALRRASDALGGIPLLLGTAAAALVVLRPRERSALVLAAGAAAAWGSAMTLRAAIQAIAESDPRGGAYLALAASGWAALPLAAGAEAARRGPRGLALLLALSCAAPAISPLSRMLPPPPPLPGPVPAAEPGLPVLLPALDPRDSAFEAQLNEAGLWYVSDDRWWCGPPYLDWRLHTRAAVALALPPDAPVEALIAALPPLLARGVQRLALVGQAPAPPGRLGDWLARPTARFLLDPPPPLAHIAEATPQGLRWAGDPPPAEGARCGLVIRPGMPIGELYALGREWGDRHRPCSEALALIFPGQPARADGWRPPLACP